MCSAERTDHAERRADRRDAATIAVAVGVVGVSFGALAPAAGLSPLMTMAMSMLVFAGGAQLAVTGILAAGGGVVAAVVAGLVLNLRHLPFGLAVAPTLGTGPSRFLAAHVVTDESTAFVLARGSGTPRARRAFRTLGVLKYGFWQVGTALGLVLGTVVPDPTAFGVDAAFPAAMLAMLVPMLRQADARRVGAGAAAAALIASPFAPAGVPVLAGLLGVGLAGGGSGRASSPPPGIGGPGRGPGSPAAGGPGRGPGSPAAGGPDRGPGSPAAGGPDRGPGSPAAGGPAPPATDEPAGGPAPPVTGGPDRGPGPPHTTGEPAGGPALPVTGRPDRGSGSPAAGGPAPPVTGRPDRGSEPPHTTGEPAGGPAPPATGGPDRGPGPDGAGTGGRNRPGTEGGGDDRDGSGVRRGAGGSGTGRGGRGLGVRRAGGARGLPGAGLRPRARRGDRPVGRRPPERDRDDRQHGPDEVGARAGGASGLLGRGPGALLARWERIHRRMFATPGRSS